ncbi:unnamed protein product [Peniophora sp. CBMAI 1063]|nr:unnamed protein product [Peniophora sp. CBMAI 1063]
MPSVPAPAKVLVTGANGFLGAWIVRTLLEHGYSVRGTVRTADKGETIRGSLGERGDRFEYVVVEDVLKEGAFDDAMEGVRLLMHTLSPLLWTDKPDDIIQPAVTGTLSLLQSAQKHREAVRRVVVTGSICTIIDWPTVEPRVYDETSVNETSIKAVEDGSTDPIAIYSAAKTQAENRAWAFMREQNITEFDLVCLHGSFFVGPNSYPLPSPASFTESLYTMHSIVTRGHLVNALVKTGCGWIDVRDIALAHVLAAQKDEAGGQRIIVSAGDCVVGDFHRVACSLDPSLVRETQDVLSKPRYRFDTSKMRKVLGLVPRSLEETIRDTLDFLRTVPGSGVTWTSY